MKLVFPTAAKDENPLNEKNQLFYKILDHSDTWRLYSSVYIA